MISTGWDGPAGFASVDRPKVWPRLRGEPHPERLEAPLDSLPGIGPRIAARLRKLGLGTVLDLLEHRPRDYQRAVGESRIVDLFGEQEAVIAGEVRSVSLRRTRGRLTVLKATVADESGAIPAVWFNQDWLVDKLQPGTHVRLRGQLRRNEFAVRSYDLNGGASTADLAPIYPAGEEITPPRMRALADRALALVHNAPDPLPARLKHAERLPRRADALHALHRPRTLEEAEIGRRRLAFDELLLLQLGLARRNREREREVAPGLGRPGDLLRRYRETLPFELTPHQEQAIEELDADLCLPMPMHRLLQGDVGSGKTVVALYALLRGGRAGVPGRADGSDGDSGRAALPDPGGALPRAGRLGRAADELGRQAGARPGRGRGDPRRHARADPGGRRARPARRRRGRRAAPVRGRAAARRSRRAARRTFCT